MVPQNIDSISKHSSHAQKVRSRVKKACERCRLKKCKCDGASPCGRCVSGDLICGYKMHRKSDKTIYSNGYVQMLERHQVQLTAGVQELYQQQQNERGSSGQRPRDLHYKKPPTHEILDGLGILDSTEWDNSDYSRRIYEGFEEYSPTSKRLTDTTASPVTRSIFPAAQIAFSRSQPTTEMRCDDQTDHCNALDPAFTETLCQCRQQTNTFDIRYWHIDDKYVSEIDVQLTAEIDNPTNWSTFVI